MRPQQIPISYAKINPSGQLVVGLEDGTILNAGYVFGPSGPTGASGPIGPLGPTGPRGASLSVLKTFDDKLYYTIDNKTFIAGSLPTITGPTGKAGTSINRVFLDVGGNLHLVSNLGQDFNVGRVYGPTGMKGPFGPPGPIGPTGAQGKSFQISRMQTINNRLIVTDDNGKSFDCGIIAVTGITGPPGYYDSIYIENDNLHFKYKNKVIDAGNIKGPTGERGPIGHTGPVGPLNCIRQALVENGKIVLVDRNGRKTYSSGDSLVGPTGSTGPIGPIGPPINIETKYTNDGQLELYMNDTMVTIIGPTGSTGPIGITGPRGGRGIVGHTGCTGPTGPKYSFENISIDDSIITFKDVNSSFSIKMPTGPTGPMLQLESIDVNNEDKLVLTDVHGHKYTSNHKLPCGPQGPPGMIKDVYTKDTSLFLVGENDQVFEMTGLQGPTGCTGPRGPRGKLTNIKQVVVTPNGQLTLIDNCDNITTSDESIIGPTGHTGVGIARIKDNIVYTTDEQCYRLNVPTGATGCTGCTGPPGMHVVTGQVIDNKLTLFYENGSSVYVEGDLSGPTGCTGPMGELKPYNGTGVFGSSLFEQDGNKSYSYIIDSLRKPSSFYPTHLGLGLHTSLYSTPDYTSIVLGNHLCDTGPNNEPNAVAIGNYSGQQSQGQHSIAIGFCAGYHQQESFAIAIGDKAARYGQGAHSLAIGYKAGFKSCLPFSNCIGFRTEAPHANVNVINASAQSLSSMESGATFIKPIRQVTADKNKRYKQLYYDQDTGELVVLNSDESNLFI
jgi:hypothetical protein